MQRITMVVSDRRGVDVSMVNKKTFDRETRDSNFTYTILSYTKLLLTIGVITYSVNSCGDINYYVYFAFAYMFTVIFTLKTFMTYSITRKYMVIHESIGFNHSPINGLPIDSKIVNFDICIMKTLEYNLEQWFSIYPERFVR